jgi:hypothetical protein
MKRPSKKGSIQDDIEKLKQRREDRKNKNNEEKKSNQQYSEGKCCDAEYESQMKKKKILFNQEPDNVNFT